MFEWKYLFYYTQNYIIFVLKFAIFYENKFPFLKFVFQFSSQLKELTMEDMCGREKREILASYASIKIDFNKWIVKKLVFFKRNWKASVKPKTDNFPDKYEWIRVISTLVENHFQDFGTHLRKEIMEDRSIKSFIMLAWIL